MNLVRVKRDQLAPLSGSQQSELRSQSEKPNSTIDYSEIPPLDDAFWNNAVANPFYKPTKTHASVRIDSDVLAWLKAQGKGYQTRMNQILREAMIRSQQGKAKP